MTENVSKTALIALGANVPSAAGSPRRTLEEALSFLDRRGIRVAARSRWYASPAYPPGAGPDFVNGAAVLETGLSPDALLAALHAVERALGRDRRRRWAPRVCDLDLLACGDALLPDPETHAAWRDLAPGAQATETPEGLILPHPRLQDRGFVLAPLAEIAPDWIHPALGLSVRDLLAALPPGALAGLDPID